MYPALIFISFLSTSSSKLKLEESLFQLHRTVCRSLKNIILTDTWTETKYNCRQKVKKKYLEFLLCFNYHYK